MVQRKHITNKSQQLLYCTIARQRLRIHSATPARQSDIKKRTRNLFPNYCESCLTRVTATPDRYRRTPLHLFRNLLAQPYSLKHISFKYSPTWQWNYSAYTDTILVQTCPNLHDGLRTFPAQSVSPAVFAGHALIAIKPDTPPTPLHQRRILVNAGTTRKKWGSLTLFISLCVTSFSPPNSTSITKNIMAICATAKKKHANVASDASSPSTFKTMILQMTWNQCTTSYCSRPLSSPVKKAEPLTKPELKFGGKIVQNVLENQNLVRNSPLRIHANNKAIPKKNNDFWRTPPLAKGSLKSSIFSKP